MMGSYNWVNGTYACENAVYLTDILRDEWGFDGYTMTDWGACNDPVAGIAAGLDLVMPGPDPLYAARIREAVEAGQLDEAIVHKAAERILTSVFRYQEQHRSDAAFDFEQAHEKAGKIAGECAVLLKNEDNILPLANQERVLIVGSLAKKPRFQGGGSSYVKPYKVSGARENLKKKANVAYLDFEADSLPAEVKKADKVVIFAGVPEADEFTKGSGTNDSDHSRSSA